jgi:hypothetical protein
MGTWLNADSLYIKTGVDEGAPHTGGEINVEGILRVQTFTLDLTKLSTTPIIMHDVSILDKGIRVEKVTLDVITAATTGTSATLNIGFISTDRTTAYPTGTPNQAIIAALAVASINTQGQVPDFSVGTTGVGNRVGQTLGQNALLTASTGTGTYTAGLLQVRIFYTVPNV